VHPADLPVTHQLVGPDAVHRQLVEWLDMLGLRTQTATADELTHEATEIGAVPRRPAEVEAGEPVRASFSRAGGDPDGVPTRFSRSRDG
jgi:hypothetical protein